MMQEEKFLLAFFKSQCENDSAFKYYVGMANKMFYILLLVVFKWVCKYVIITFRLHFNVWQDLQVCN